MTKPTFAQLPGSGRPDIGRRTELTQAFDQPGSSSAATTVVNTVVQSAPPASPAQAGVVKIDAPMVDPAALSLATWNAHLLNSVGNATKIQGVMVAPEPPSDGQVLTYSASVNEWVYGTPAGTYTLPAATATTLGGVIVGAGLSVTGGGTLSASVTSVAGRTGAVTLSYTDISGLGSAATMAASAFDAAGAAASVLASSLQKLSNLSDLASAATARTNLGLGTAATYNVPASGNASPTQVVLGSDTRLTSPKLQGWQFSEMLEASANTLTANTTYDAGAFPPDPYNGNSVTYTLASVLKLSLGTAPTGGSFTLDIYLNGSSIFGANGPITVTSGNTAPASYPALTTTTANTGDVLSWRVGAVNGADRAKIYIGSTATF